jgi:WD40 repeat protein
VVADTAGTWILDERGQITPWAPPHRAAPTAVAVSADGTRIGVAYADGLVRLGRRDGRPVDVATAGARIAAIAFAPTVTSAATAGADGVVRLLDPDTGAAIDTLAWHGVPVTGVSYAPDGESLATCDASGRVAMWDMTSIDELPLLRAADGFAARVAFSPTSKFLAGCVDQGVAIWHLASGKLVATIGSLAGPAARFAYAGDGAVILTEGPAGTIEVRDPLGDRPVATLSLADRSDPGGAAPAAPAAVEAIACPPPSARLRVAAVGCLDGSLHVFVDRLRRVDRANRANTGPLTPVNPINTHSAPGGL